MGSRNVMIRIKVVKSFLAIHQFTVKFEHCFSIYDRTNKRRINN